MEEGLVQGVDVKSHCSVASNEAPRYYPTVLVLVEI